MEHFRIRPLTERDLDAVLAAAGGMRAHSDADRRDQPGADYRLGEALIELKELNDEGFDKPERQKKLAALFYEHAPRRPVIVLDKTQLPPALQARYDRIVEGPIKTVVAKSRKQLKRSRIEIPEATCTVLFLVNSGYTALNHEELTRLAAHRVRNDTDEVDAVVVAGCYYHSDGFDNYFLWPIDCVPIKLERPFASFERLREAWNGFANEFMTALVRGKFGEEALRGPVVDTDFSVDGVTYVKPVPPIGEQSKYFGPRRPRIDSAGLLTCPPVAITFPDLSRQEWARFRAALRHAPDLFDTYEEWRMHREGAVSSGSALKPFAPIVVIYEEWETWCADTGRTRSMSAFRDYASSVFDQKVKAVLLCARERQANSILPPWYVLTVTEVIGQDRANDISHIAYVRERPDGEPVVRPVVENARIFHEHALALASAYAVLENLSSVLYVQDLRYAWV